MKNDHSPLTKPKDKALVFETKYGQVMFLHEHPAQPVFVCLPGEEPRRVRGAEKRLLITMLVAVEAARRRPLPAPGQN